jgi:hypothetical protein
MVMAGTRKSDSKTDAQRVFEELLRKTDAHLKEKASLEFEGGKQDGVFKKESQALNDEVCSFELAPD